MSSNHWSGASGAADQQLFCWLFSQLRFGPFFGHFCSSDLHEEGLRKLRCGHRSRRMRRNGAQRGWILMSEHQFSWNSWKDGSRWGFQPVSGAASWLSALWLSGRLLSSSDVGENNSMFSWCAAVASQHLSVWLMFASGCLQTGAFKVLQRFIETWKSSLEDPSPEPSQRNPAEPPPTLIVIILF